MRPPNASPPPLLTRRIGMVLSLGLLGLIVAGVLIKEPWLSDAAFWLVRWPLWALVAVGLPLLVLRIVLWQRRRREPRGPR